MKRIKAPLIPEQSVPVVPEDALRRIFAACEGKSSTQRRDTAIITLLLDTGIRAAEIANLKLDVLDFDYEVVGILAKGRRERPVPFGRKSAVALDRYLRVRARHKDANLPWLWLGMKGRLTQNGSTRSPPTVRTSPPTSVSSPTQALDQASAAGSFLHMLVAAPSRSVRLR